MSSDNAKNWNEIFETLFSLAECTPLTVNEEVHVDWQRLLSKVAEYLNLKSVNIFRFTGSPSDKIEIVANGLVELNLYSDSQFSCKISNSDYELIFSDCVEIDQLRAQHIRKFSKLFFKAVGIQQYVTQYYDEISYCYDCLNELPFTIVLFDQYFCCQFINEVGYRLIEEHPGFFLEDKNLFYFYSGNVLTINSLYEGSESSLLTFESTSLLLKQCGFQVNNHNVIDLNIKGNADNGKTISYCLFIYDNSISKINSDSFEYLKLKLIKDINLSEKEAILSVHIGMGVSTSEYSDKVSRSLKTIQTQIKSILKKTKLHNQSELIKYISNLLVDYYFEKTINALINNNNYVESSSY